MTEDLEEATLYLAATRPALFFGVPLTLAGLFMMLAGFLIVIVQNPFMKLFSCRCGLERGSSWSAIITRQAWSCCFSGQRGGALMAIHGAGQVSVPTRPELRREEEE